MITTFPEYISLACIPFLVLYFSCVPAFPFDSSCKVIHTRQMLKHVGVSLSCYTGFRVQCPIQAAQKPVAIMYQQWLLLGLLTQGM